jgi:hypothetical protein
MALAILFFPLATGAMGLSTDLRVLDVDGRLGSTDMGFSPNVHYSLLTEAAFHPSYTGPPTILDFVTVYTNLTKTVFLVAESNNSLLNVKDHFWIQVHVDCDIMGIGPVPAGYHFTGRLALFGTWVNVTCDDLFFSVRMRRISSAAEIDEIVNDVAEYFAEVNVNTAISWILQALIIGGIPAMVVIGRWRMSTL